MILFEAYILCVIVWLYFLVVMQFKQARDKGKLTHPVVQAHAAVFVGAGVGFYIILNLTVGTVFFLDFPRELRFTKRCQRYLRGESQWPKWGWLLRYRLRLAEEVCEHLLDPFEDGGHC